MDESKNVTEKNTKATERQIQSVQRAINILNCFTMTNSALTPVNAHALARPGSETGFVKQRRPQHVLPISILADISILVKRTQNSMDCAFVQIELIADLSQR